MLRITASDSAPGCASSARWSLSRLAEPRTPTELDEERARSPSTSAPAPPPGGPATSPLGPAPWLPISLTSAWVWSRSCVWVSFRSSASTSIGTGGGGGGRTAPGPGSPRRFGVAARRRLATAPAGAFASTGGARAGMAPAARGGGGPAAAASPVGLLSRAPSRSVTGARAAATVEAIRADSSSAGNVPEGEAWGNLLAFGSARGSPSEAV